MISVSARRCPVHDGWYWCIALETSPGEFSELLWVSDCAGVSLLSKKATRRHISDALLLHTGLTRDEWIDALLNATGEEENDD